MSECVTLSSVRNSGPLTVTGASGDKASALGQALVAGPGGAAEVGPDVLAGALRVAADPETTAAGLAAAGHTDRRRRVFTGMATVATILGLCLFRRDSYDLVIGRTLATVPRVRVEGNPSGAALSKARVRLAGDAMRLVFESNYVGKLERGVICWPCPEYREALRSVLGVQTNAEIGLHQPKRNLGSAGYRNLAAQLTSRDVQVTLITQATPHPVRIDGARVETLPRTDDLTAHRHAVAEALTRIRPDVVDCSTWEAETHAYLHSGGADRAPVLVRGEFSAATLGAADLARDEHELVHRADRVSAVSAFATADLAAAYHIPTPAVVANGIDRTRFHPGPIIPPTGGYRITLDHNGQPDTRQPATDLFPTGEPLPPWTPDPDGRLNVVWVGKITPMKGWDTLETIIRRLRDIATVTVLLGHTRAYLPVTLDANRDVTILHDLPDTDLPSFYRAADWLLSTSRWEGFGLAIAEALACGTPVVLPDTLGTAPQLLAGGGGYRYRDPDHLATLLTQAPRPAAARLPDAFDWATNTEATLAIYRDLNQARSTCGSC